MFKNSILGIVAYCQKEEITFPILLFLDGHPGHYGLHIRDYCLEHGIILHLLKAHCTQLLQANDKYFFNAAKKRTETLACKWVANNPGKTLKKYDKIKEILYPAFEETGAKKDNIINSFKISGTFPFDSRNVEWDKTKAAEIFAKNAVDDEVPDYVVFPPLEHSADTALDCNVDPVEQITVNVGVIPGSPTIGAQIVDEFADISQIDDIENDTGDSGLPSASMTSTHSMPGFPGFSASSVSSFSATQSVSLSASGSATSTATATSTSSSEPTSQQVFCGSATASASSYLSSASASGSDPTSGLLKSVANVTLVQRQEDLFRYEWVVLSEAQRDEFKDLFDKGILDINEPKFKAWLVLKQAATPPPPPTEEDVFDQVIRNSVPRNIPRSASKRKPIGPPGPDRNDPNSDAWKEILQEQEDRRKMPRLERKRGRGRGRGRGGGRGGTRGGQRGGGK